MDSSRFKSKNENSIKLLNETIDGGGVKKMVMSTELAYYLSQTLEDFKLHEEPKQVIQVYDYRRVRILADPYHPPYHVGVIYKSQSIKFDVPCICGYYKGEGHGPLKY